MARLVPGYAEVDLEDVVEEGLKELAAKSSAVSPSFALKELDKWLQKRVVTNGMALGRVLTKLVKEGRLELECFYEGPSIRIMFIYQRQ